MVRDTVYPQGILHHGSSCRALDASSTHRCPRSSILDHHSVLYDRSIPNEVFIHQTARKKRATGKHRIPHSQNEPGRMESVKILWETSNTRCTSFFFLLILIILSHYLQFFSSIFVPLSAELGGTPHPFSVVPYNLSARGIFSGSTGLFCLFFLLLFFLAIRSLSLPSLSSLFLFAGNVYHYDEFWNVALWGDQREYPWVF